jgi:flavin reductase (DIM6/NTAB) family NADH-FMN oxidoreductase RutF
MRVPVPAALKRGLRPTSQWLAISLTTPQQIADVRLVTPAGEFDVTANNAVAALRPLTIRLGLDAQLQSAVEAAPKPELHLVDRKLRRTIGVLRLKHSRDWNTAGVRIGLFEVVHGRHYCAHWLRRAWDSWMYQHAVRNTPPEKLLMVPTAVEQLMVFSLCPRPVFFVSVDDGQHSNIFPMDLVGPLLAARFTLALRNTSPSVETIKNARKVALSDAPGTACQIAYQLGTHHKKQEIDWDTLPFKIRRSREFSLPVPEISLRVREVEILDFQSIGSHTLFVGRICSDESLTAGAQLCHTSGIHQRLRTRHKRPFEEAFTPSASTAQSP